MGYHYLPISSSSPTDSAEIRKLIRIDCKRNVFPARSSHHERIKLSPLDLPFMLCNYNQKGVIYQIPADNIPSAVELLAQKLSEVLVYFYAFAGRLITSSSDGGIYIDCNDAGAEFVEASADDLCVADVTGSEITPIVVELFPMNGVIGLEGHHLPLMAIQVTKFRDGISVTCTHSHALADGASLWDFYNSWAELCRGAETISEIPVHDRSLLCPQPPVRLNLDPNGEVSRLCPPPFRVKFFHFTKEMMKGLKDAANRDSVIPISSLQALCSHVWVSITRARRLGPEDTTTFRFYIDCRRRLVPPLSGSYFGNGVQSVGVTATVGDLLKNGISFPAGLLHGFIHGHDEKAIRERLGEWERNPTQVQFDKLPKNCLLMGSSPRFKAYETDFGWGEPVAVRSGIANKIDGKIHAYPGKEGGGSVDLEICLAPDMMESLENDTHFLCLPAA